MPFLFDGTCLTLNWNCSAGAATFLLQKRKQPRPECLPMCARHLAHVRDYADDERSERPLPLAILDKHYRLR